MKKVLVLLVLGISLNATAQEKDERFLSINYFQKISFMDFGVFTESQNQMLPTLHRNARMHGMEVCGGVGRNFYIALSALGSLQDKKNEIGYTSWGGATGTFSVEYRLQKWNFFLVPTLGLGCGRFTYSTAFSNGSNSLTSHVDAFFAEPKLKIGYIVRNRIILNVELSRIIAITENDSFVGADVSKQVFPENLMLGFSLGCTLPNWSK